MKKALIAPAVEKNHTSRDVHESKPPQGEEETRSEFFVVNSGRLFKIYNMKYLC